MVDVQHCILGIDPGSRLTGYGLVAVNGRKATYIASGCINTEDGDLPSRLGMIYQGVSEIISQYSPSEMAIEEVFMAKKCGLGAKVGSG
jgi:crossover junction endodeoxyribonuclease RuvC